jgi:hypothetical protein
MLVRILTNLHSLELDPTEDEEVEEATNQPPNHQPYLCKLSFDHESLDVIDRMNIFHAINNNFTNLKRKKKMFKQKERERVM